MFSTYQRENKYEEGKREQVRGRTSEGGRQTDNVCERDEGEGGGEKTVSGIPSETM